MAKQEERVVKSVSLTPEQWEYVRLFGKVEDIVKYAQKFAPLGPGKAKPRGEKGHFLSSKGETDAD